MNLLFWSEGLVADSNENGINRAYDGRNLIIKKIYKYTNKGADKIYFVTTGIGLTNYWVFVEDAIQYCEVKPCKDFKPGTTSTTGSVADELLKMKKLLDSGAITQIEYDAQKKKLLIKNKHLLASVRKLVVTSLSASWLHLKNDKVLVLSRKSRKYELILL